MGDNPQTGAGKRLLLQIRKNETVSPSRARARDGQSVKQAVFCPAEAPSMPVLHIPPADAFRAARRPHRRALGLSCALIGIIAGRVTMD